MQVFLHCSDDGEFTPVTVRTVHVIAAYVEYHRAAEVLTRDELRLRVRTTLLGFVLE